MSEPSAATPPPHEEPRPEIGRDVVDDAAETGPISEAARTMPAERIGKYEVVSLLGRGGMGAVFQAFDPILERDVAIKVMLPQIAEDPEQKQRFEREARAIARLTHANVVTVFDLGYHTDGAPYIVMELLEGQDLLQLMHREPPLSFSQKISIVIQVLDGLGKAHKLGVVHRDVKPANVSISEDGTAKIMDFGIAHLASASATLEGSIMGTAAYMSPEQARGERVDGRSDLFSVGSLLCELITGRRPFEAETIMATLYAIDHNDPEIELPEGPEYERLRPVLEKALTKDREKRYQTSAEFARGLAGCLDDSATFAARAATLHAPKTDPGVVAPATPRSEPTRTVSDSSASRRAARLEAKPPTGQAANPSRLFRLLREVYVGSKSGHLHFTAGSHCRSLRILKGQILFGKSDVEGEHLGDVLVRHGMITEDDRKKAVEKVLSERRRLGEVLVSEEVLDRARLEEALGLHVREILFAMLEGPEGSHSFEETGETLPAVDAVCPLSTGEVILEATRYVQDPELVRKVLGDTSRRLALSPNPMLRSQKITLTPVDGFVMSRVDGTLSAQEVLSLSPMPVEDTERSLFGLVCTGIIGYEDTTNQHRTNPRVSRSQPRTTTVGPVATGTKPPTPPAARTTAPPSPLPEAPPEPTTNPGSGSEETAAGSRGSGASEQDTEELRRLVVETHERLKRDHFEVLGLERSATPDDVRQAYACFARALHPDARRPPELADLEEKARDVFLRVTAAYEALKDPETRRRYEIAFEPSKLRRPPSPPAPTPEAKKEEAAAPPPPAKPETDPRTSGFDPAATLRDAEALFAKKEYWDVIQKVEPLLPQTEGPHRTRGVLLLARAYMKNPHWQKRAEEALLRLLDDDPQCTPAYLFLAQIYAGQDLPSRARSMYRKVVELEPENQVARAALEGLEPAPEEEPGPEPAAGGGLRGWFKR
jgi:serine/threonine protein kinase/tetratricopeptide (TPR) repeat protein